MTRQYDNYADLITFSRSSSGTALRPISYGPEIVTNGTFDAGDFTGFSTVGAAWSVIGGEAVGNDTTSLNNFLVWQDGASAGKIYLGSVDVISNDVIGNSYIQWGLDTNTRVTSPSAGTYTQIFTGSAELFRANVNASSGSLVLDNISVKEVLFDQPNAPLTLFNHPAGIPRIEYDADGNRLGLLIEESRTNLLTYSEDFDNAAWIISNNGTGSVTKSTANAAASPDGTLTADRIIFDLNGGETTGDLALLRQANSTTGSLTHSVYLRSFDGVSSYTMQLILPDGNGENITVTGSWQRFEVSATAAGNVNYGVRLRGGQLPANSDYADVLIWGAQLEAGAFPTSYIPTSGATATRAADVASIPVSAFGYNQSAVTVVVEADSSGGIDPRPFEISDGTTNNRARLDINDNLYFRAVVSSGGSVVVNTEVGFTGFTSLFKAALAYAENDFVGVLNGSVELQDANGATPSITVIYLGSNHDGTTNYLNGHIKSIKYYPRRLTNAQLQELTT